MHRRKLLTLILTLLVLTMFSVVAQAKILREATPQKTEIPPSAPTPQPSFPPVAAQDLMPPSSAAADKSAPNLAPVTPAVQFSGGIVDYFPVLPYGASPDAAPEFVPVVSNKGLRDDHKGMTRVVFYIHDDSRNAQQAMGVLEALAGTANETVFMIAPQFLLESDLALYADKLPDKGRMFSRWVLGTWDRGDDAIAVNQGRGVSSFTVLDLMLMYVTDKGMFPDVQEIVIAGMGAGAHFVEHYAAVGKVSSLLAQQKVPVRYVGAETPSYLYLTATRYLGPKLGFGPLEEGKCPTYNIWPYGLDQMNSYTRRSGANAAKANYALRDITYLRGEDSSATLGSDTTCAALAEGPTQSIRANTYAFYLKNIYGTDSEAYHKFVTVPKVGYDITKIFGSHCGVALLFGNGQCVEDLGVTIIDSKSPTRP